jgi:hypothetical protein
MKVSTTTGLAMIFFFLRTLLADEYAAPRFSDLGCGGKRLTY